MLKPVVLVSVGLFLVSGQVLKGASYAATVVEYDPGSGAAVGYDNPEGALGEPSRVNPGMFGGPVDPFNPPFLPEQLVSIGAGGMLTISFALPILDALEHAFGLDFLVFGNNGFTIVNGDFSGGGVTDGSTFTFDPPGASRVSVSDDGVTYYELRPPPGLNPIVDGLFPTDGAGDFQQAVDPALVEADLADLGLAGIRSLYGDSGGGTGFDIGWATTADGQSVALPSIQFVRLEVLSGKAEIDALVAVPEPGAGLLLLVGAGLGCLACRVREKWSGRSK